MDNLPLNQRKLIFKVIINFFLIIFNNCTHEMVKPVLTPHTKTSSVVFFQAKLGSFKTLPYPICYITPIDAKRPDELLFKDLIESSFYQVGPLALGEFHFMNIKPGKYRIVAFKDWWHMGRTNNSSQGLSITGVLYLSNEDMKKTEFEIGPSELKILGRFNIDYTSLNSSMLPMNGKLSEKHPTAKWKNFQANNDLGTIAEIIKDEKYLYTEKERFKLAYTGTQWEYLLQNITVQK